MKQMTQSLVERTEEVTDMAGTGRPGRRSKGDRKVYSFRLNAERDELLKRVVAAEGYEYLSDWVAKVIEDKLAESDPDAPEQRQKELPFREAS